MMSSDKESVLETIWTSLKPSSETTTNVSATPLTTTTPPPPPTTIPIIVSSTSSTSPPSPSTSPVTDPVTYVEDSDDQFVTIIAYACGGGFVLIFFVIVVVILWRKRCKRPRFEPPELPHPEDIDRKYSIKQAVEPPDSFAALGDAPPPPTPTTNNPGQPKSPNNPSVVMVTNNAPEVPESENQHDAIYEFSDSTPWEADLHSRRSQNSCVSTGDVQMFLNGTAVFTKTKDPPVDKAVRPDPEKESFVQLGSQSLGRFDRIRSPLVSQSGSKSQTLQKIAESQHQHWWTMTPTVIHGPDKDEDKNDDDGHGGYFKMDKRSPSKRISLSPPAPKDIEVETGKKVPDRSYLLSIPPTPCGKGKTSGYINEMPCAPEMDFGGIYQNTLDMQTDPMDTLGGTDFYENLAFSGKHSSVGKSQTLDENGKRDASGLDDSSAVNHPISRQQESFKYANISNVSQAARHGSQSSLRSTQDPPQESLQNRVDPSDGEKYQQSESEDQNEESSLYENLANLDNISVPTSPRSKPPVSPKTIKTVRSEPILDQTLISNPQPQEDRAVSKPIAVESKTDKDASYPKLARGVSKPSRVVPKPTSPIALTMSSTASQPAIIPVFPSSKSGSNGSTISRQSPKMAKNGVSRSPKKVLQEKESDISDVGSKTNTTKNDTVEDNVYEMASSPFESQDDNPVYVNVPEEFVFKGSQVNIPAEFGSKVPHVNVSREFGPGTKGPRPPVASKPTSPTAQLSSTVPRTATPKTHQAPSEGATRPSSDTGQSSPSEDMTTNGKSPLESAAKVGQSAITSELQKKLNSRLKKL